MNGFRTSAIALTFALTGCAGVTPDPMVVDVIAPVVSPDVTEVQGEPAETPIPTASLLPLLQAEFALRLRDFDQGLALLTEQAMTLTDPALARRALRLAEFVNDNDRASMMAVRLVELDPKDGAAASAASGWLARTGRPVESLYYAGIAYELGNPVNVATHLGSYEQLDGDTQAAVAEAIRALATR